MSEIQSKTIEYALVGLFIIAVGTVLHIMASLLIPFAISVFVVAMVYPIIEFLTRCKIPQALGIMIVLLLVGAVISGLGYLIYLNLSQLMEVLPDRITGLLSKLFWLTTFLEEHNVQLDVDTLIQHLNPAKVTEWLSNITGSFASFLGSTALIIVYAILMILEVSSTHTKITKAFTKRAQWINSTLAHITQNIKGYMITKTWINFGAGILTWISCWLLGLDTPVLWGILAFLFSYIPTLGALLSVGLPSLLAFLQFDTTGPFILVFIVLILIHGVLLNLIEPRLYGSSLQLSPLMIIISLIFWTWIWGITGAFLSVPILAATKIVTAHFETTKPISILLGQG